MMRYAELYGNIKKSEIKNSDYNKMNVTLANEIVRPISISDELHDNIDSVTRIGEDIANALEGVGAIEEITKDLGKLIFTLLYHFKSFLKHY